MIRSCGGICEINGRSETVMADFSVIVRTLKRDGIDREYLDEAYERGFLTDEELKNELKEKRSDLVGLLMKAMEDINDLEDEVNE